MKDFFKLWFMYLKLIFKVWKEYRIDFIIGISAMFLANIASVIYFWVIFQNVITLNGWTFGQILFLSGMLSVVSGFWHTFLSGLSPWRIEEDIRRGRLDRVLLTPISTLRYYVMSNIDEDGFGELIAAFLILITGAHLSGIILGIQNIALLTIFIISGILILFSIFTIFSCLAFWTTKVHSIAESLFHLMVFIKYPLEIYNPLIVFFLTFVLPLGFINYYPAEIFLGKGLYLQLSYLAPFIGIIFLIISYSLWKFSLKHYTSTGT